MTLKGPSQPKLFSYSDLWCLEGHLTPSLHSCPMHTQPPCSLGLDHTVVEPFPSLRLQRWTNSAIALPRCKLPSSLKWSALRVSSLAAIHIPQLLPQEACGYWAVPDTIWPRVMPSAFSPPWPQNMNKGLICLPSITVPQVALSLLLLLLSCNRQWESASHVPSVLRSYSCFQIKGAGTGLAVPVAISDTHWKSRVVRNCCRRGEEVDKGRQVFSWCKTALLLILLGGLLRALLHATFHMSWEEWQQMLVARGRGDLVVLYFLPWKICFWRRRSEMQSSNLREGFLACSSEGLEIEWSGVCHEASLHWSFYLLKLG